jgi:membrane protein YdbS with pleckstrin-like domain
MTQIATTPTPAPDNRPHRPADDSEEVYFEGSPLLRAEFGKVAIFGLIGIAIIALVTTDAFKWHSSLPWWMRLLAIAVAIGLFFIPSITRRTVRYRITNYRIDVTSGFFSRNIDTIELWHVEDIRLHQSLFNRMVGVGTIAVSSRDQVLPLLSLRGLPRPQELFKMLEQRIIAVKRQRGVMKVDPG